MTTPLPPAIRRADTADIARLSILLADAFLISPVGDWLIPDLGERRTVYLRYFEIFVRHELEHGVVDVTTDLTGVAIWHPRDESAPAPDNYDELLADATGPWADRFCALDKTFDEHHPGTFHHHLLFLGVVPSEQSRGIGSALLRHHHARLDTEGIPAYLEASMPRNRDLYLRHTYTAADPFYLPGDGPPLWPMWREPRSSEATTREQDSQS